MVRELRNRLLSGKSIASLGTYTTILIGIRLFLRADEFLGIRMDHFFPDAFMRDPITGDVIALNMKIFGKTDKKWQYRWLWANEKYPDICPVRHLLVYLYLTGIKKDYLFPPHSCFVDMEEVCKSGTFGQIHLPYVTFQAGFKQLVQETVTGSETLNICLLYTSPSPRDQRGSRMPSSA